MSAVVTESKRSEVLMWECYVMEGRQVEEVEEVEEEVLLLQMIRLRSRWPSDEITNTFKKKMQTEGATFVHSCPSLYELNISTISPQNTRIYLHYLSLGVPMNDGMIHKTHIYV